MADIEQMTEGVSLRVLHRILIVATFLVAAGLLIATFHSSEEFTYLAESTNEYVDMQKSATELMEASDYLTEMVQRFTLAGEREYLDAYFEEAEITQRREKAVEALATNSKEHEALLKLQAALNESIELMEREYYAMKLVVEATGLNSYPQVISEVTLSSEDAALSPDVKMQRAREMVLGREYYDQKNLIRSSLEESLVELENIMRSDQNGALVDLGNSMHIVRIFIIVLTLLIIVMIWLTSKLGINPILKAVNYINANNPIPEIGANEFRYLAKTYNKMYEVYKKSLDNLSYKANHDELTGAYNRAGYDLILTTLDMSATYMIMFDLDNFKEINDSHGHEVGDLVLKKTVAVIAEHFRSDDYICRIGGDEFVVFMVHADQGQRRLLEKKVKAIISRLSQADDGVPASSASVGIAHGAQVSDLTDWFRAADKALYAVKRNGKNGVSFYES